ncbi:TonB-linked outer membrane protein, SusC/RagA family [Pedobacter sp. ok626]|uniref:SusC/RagA family TonB-linked outer membrane protein n=1 Tax=Pedobacter sp. ok626 TaxID=1761882 RepID=UPI00088104A8|nr:TonB-dependent receptor [Pedobacter sp. ok626]SDJ07415.1 TonB-linked outer membrane protein, SusC/RagA family [Pedobacter sp. ok626]
MNLKLLSKFSWALLLMLLACTTLYAQERKVTGKVVDKTDGQPIPGVNVSIKGKPSNVSTNAQGVYTIQVSSDADVLVFSYIGFLRQTIPVGKLSNIDVSLASDNKDLDEVVVVGYGTQKKTHLTGAVASVDIKNIEDIPTTNLAAALRGQLPGVGITGGVSRPGENASITIRNPIFFAKDGKTDPLYIIDDIQRSLNDFNMLDASEVESISVLKDAAAAIYGILGANGVIVVRTKRGKVGAPKINYSGSYGITDATMLPKMMNGIQQASYLNNMLQGKNGYNLSPTGVIGTTTNKEAGYYSPDELEYFTANSSDHVKEAWQSSYVTRHALNVSGGSDKATYFAGGSYTQQNSNFKGVNTNKLTFRASTDAKVANGLKVGLGVSGDLYYNKRYYFKQGSESLDNDFKSLLASPQFMPFYYNGLPVLQAANTGTVEGANFFEVQRLNNYTLQKTNVLNIQATAEYEVPFIKGLKASLNYNRNLNNDFSKQYGTKYTLYSFTNLGENKHIVGGNVLNTVSAKNGDIVRFTPGITDVYQLNGLLSYGRKFGKHDISMIALFEQKHDSAESLAASREGTLVGGFDNMNFATGAQATDQSNGRVVEFGRLAYATRLNYAYANKYLVEISLRADANNNFAPGKEWGFFPSTSLGWVMSEENFFKDNLKFVNFFKIRGSVGLLGNDSSKPYLYQENYRLETGKGAVFGGNNDRGLTYSPNVAIANANTTWDSNLSTNLGIDAQFLNNRLSLSADGFYAHRYNMLSALTSSVPAVIGAATPTENFAKVNTFGYEISLGWKDKIGQDVTYSFSPFFAWNDNKLLIADQPLGNVGTYLDILGQSSDRGVFGFHYLGMFRSQEEADAYATANPGYKVKGQVPKAGMLYYADVRGPKDASGNYTGPDGVVDDLDQDYLTPKSSNHYSLGLNFGGGYKGLSLNVTMGMSFGGQDLIEGDARKQASNISNRPEFWSDTWSPTNVNAKYPNPFYKDTYEMTSEFWFVNSYTFRVSNINLGYTFPSKLTQKMGIGSLKAFMVATNPINFYNPYTYRDNATSYNTYPNLQSWSFGLNVGF